MLFTDTAQFRLHISFDTTRDLGHELGQPYQIIDPKQRAPRRQFHERLNASQARPRGRQPLHSLPADLQVQILIVAAPPVDDIEGSAMQRMERMRDLGPRDITRPMMCIAAGFRTAPRMSCSSPWTSWRA
jgi:hypothetical protein